MKTEDVHQEEPVQDIVDPNLYPLRLPEPDAESMVFHLAQLERERERMIKAGKSDFDLQDIDRKIRHRKRKAEPYEAQSEATQLRQRYQWLPAEVDIAADGKVSIKTAIHRKFPRNKKNSKLYSLLELALSSMLPAFAELGLVPLQKKIQANLPQFGFGQFIAKNGGQIPKNCFEPCRRQIVFKSQKIFLKAGEGYSGKWHVEGLTEGVVGIYIDIYSRYLCFKSLYINSNICNQFFCKIKIIGIATLYLKVDRRLVGGNVKFRPEEVPGEYYDFDTDAVAAVRQSRAIVFRNMPHRLRKLVNASNDADDVAERTFVNFLHD